MPANYKDLLLVLFICYCIALMLALTFVSITSTQMYGMHSGYCEYKLYVATQRPIMAMTIGDKCISWRIR